jgi:hypothetical protein
VNASGERSLRGLETRSQGDRVAGEPPEERHPPGARDRARVVGEHLREQCAADDVAAGPPDLGEAHPGQRDEPPGPHPSRDGERLGEDGLDTVESARPHGHPTGLGEGEREVVDELSNLAGVKRWLQSAQIPADGFFRAVSDLTLGEVKKDQRLRAAFEQVLDEAGALEALQQPVLKPLLDEAAG